MVLVSVLALGKPGVGRSRGGPSLSGALSPPPAQICLPDSGLGGKQAIGGDCSCFQASCHPPMSWGRGVEVGILDCMTLKSFLVGEPLSCPVYTFLDGSWGLGTATRTYRTCWVWVLFAELSHVTAP